MPTVASIIAELKRKGTEKGRTMYSRHGMPIEHVLGVTIADLKIIAKSIKGDQALACELYATGVMEAMYLAGLVADGAQLTKAQLDKWAPAAAHLQMISEYTVPWVAVENPAARDLALKWIKAKQEGVAASGWRTYSGLVTITADAQLDLPEIETLLAKAAKEIGAAKNRVRHNMNGFVIAVGLYVEPLSKLALSTAEALGTVSVNMGDTACKVPSAAAEIQKAAAAGRVGKKRKTIRC